MNSALGFCYGLLVTEFIGAIESVGLDYQMGFFHRPRSGRPSLALDLAEGYYEVFRTVDPPYPWVYEETSAGREELPWRREGMHRLVVELPPGGERPREIITQEFWDPLWTAQLTGHEAAVKRSELGLLSVGLGPGASGTLVLEYGLQRALIAGHAITWAGLLAWAVWAAWPHLPRRLWERP